MKEQNSEQKKIVPEGCKEEYFTGIPAEVRDRDFGRAKKIYRPRYIIHRHPECGYWSLEKDDKKIIVDIRGETFYLYRIYVCSESSSPVKLGTAKPYLIIVPGETVDTNQYKIQLQLPEDAPNDAKAHGTYELLC